MRSGWILHTSRVRPVLCGAIALIVILSGCRETKDGGCDRPKTEPCAIEPSDKLLLVWKTGQCFVGGLSIVMINTTGCAEFSMDRGGVPADRTVSVLLQEEDMRDLVETVQVVTSESLRTAGCMCLDCATQEIVYSSEGFTASEWVRASSGTFEVDGTYCEVEEGKISSGEPLPPDLVRLNKVAFRLFEKYAEPIDECGHVYVRGEECR